MSLLKYDKFLVIYYDFDTLMNGNYEYRYLNANVRLMFMNIQFSSILLLTTMQTAPHSIPHLSYALPRTPGSSRHTLDSQIPQNSNTAPADNTSIPTLLNQEDLNQPSATAPNEASSDGTTKLMLQQQNDVETREQVAARMISISRNHLKDARGRKKYTIGGEANIQDHPKNSNGEGFSTSRSIPQERSLSKLSSNYLEASIREEEEIFKKIEEKALQLKQKQKKGRQILKKIIKEAVQKPQNLGSSLYAIPPIKSKFSHRRVQSCDFPIPKEKQSSDVMRSLDRVNSEQQEDEGDMDSMLGKSSEAVAAFGDSSPYHLSLQEQLSLEKKMKEKLIEQHHQDKTRLQGQLSNALQECRKSQQIISGLEKQKTQIQDGYTKRIEQLSLHYKQQLAAKEQEIVQLTTTIQQQTIKLQQIQQRYEALSTKQENSTKKIEILQKQNKTKNQEYNQAKRKLQKELAQLIEDRRKSEQSYLREIQALKQKIEAQSAEQRLLADQLSQNNKETNKKQEYQLLSVNKQKNALQDSIKNLNSQIAQLNETVSKLANINQQKEQARKTLQQYLLNAEDHIRKVEEKYHIVSRELTEKNVAYDFLWIQLQETQKPSVNGEKMQADPHVSLLHSSENDSPVKQEERGLNRILSSSTLKDIKDLKGMMQQGEKQGNHERNQSEQEIRMSFPFCHRPSLNIPLLIGSQCSADDAILEEIEPDSSKKQTGNIILKTQLSEAFSQQNDEMQEMLSNHNSNTSRMESSLGAFSQYSRIKSTQSALSHKQVEQEYQNKMKNSKMMAKLGKFKPKK